MDIKFYTMEYTSVLVESSIMLKHYTDDLYEEYKRIYEECFHEMRLALQLMPVDCCDSRTELLDKQNEIYVYIKDDILIGSIAIFGNEIDDLIVSKNYQRKGFGQILLNYAINQMQREFISPIILNVADWNKNAVRLYLKNGFCITKTKVFRRPY
jgi:Acetyltransferases